MRLKNISLLGLFLLLFSCSSGTEGISDFTTGSNLDSRGKISNESLVFSLKKFHLPGKNRDLFNNIYFQGDTICFSFRIADNDPPKKVHVYFTDPSGENRFPAERFEITGERYFGFSLLGTVLEKLYLSRLDEKADSSIFCCKDINFAIVIVVLEKRSKKEYKYLRSFRIDYR